MKVTWRQVVRWRRLRRQLLVEPAPDALAVARRVCGLHAQVVWRTHLIAGIRSATPPDLDTALGRDRSLIRTWAMRGTLHLLPADELDLWVGARTDCESRRRFPPSWKREHGVTGAQQHAISELPAEPLSKAELAAAIGTRSRVRRPYPATSVAAKCRTSGFPAKNPATSLAKRRPASLRGKTSRWFSRRCQVTRSR